MGSDYLLFTEVKIENEWHCINPIFDKSIVNSSSYPNQNRLSFTYWNGSRSNFGITASRLCENGRYVDISDLSPELQKEFEEEDWRFPMIINYIDIKKSIPKLSEFQYHGYVHKDDIFRHETDNDEIYEWFSYDDYNIQSTLFPFTLLTNCLYRF
jgi:hypothetical protein